MAAFDEGIFGVGLSVSSLSEPEDSDDNENAPGDQGKQWCEDGGVNEVQPSPNFLSRMAVCSYLERSIKLLGMF